MKRKGKWKKQWPLVFMGGMILILLSAGAYLHLPHVVTVPLVVIFSLVFAVTALWRHANKEANGSEWWQDNNASGWRGY